MAGRARDGRGLGDHKNTMKRDVIPKKSQESLACWLVNYVFMDSILFKCPKSLIVLFGMG
jgi:hypothetical protein